MCVLSAYVSVCYMCLVPVEAPLELVLQMVALCVLGTKR